MDHGLEPSRQEGMPASAASLCTELWDDAAGTAWVRGTAVDEAAARAACAALSALARELRCGCVRQQRFDVHGQASTGLAPGGWWEQAVTNNGGRGGPAPVVAPQGHSDTLGRGAVAADARLLDGWPWPVRVGAGLRAVPSQAKPSRVVGDEVLEPDCILSYVLSVNKRGAMDVPACAAVWRPHAQYVCQQPDAPPCPPRRLLVRLVH